MRKRGIIKRSQEFVTSPDSKPYTHVCRLCWPKGREADSQASATNTSQANTRDEAPPARGRASCRAARSSWGNSPQWARQLAPAITLSSRGHQTSSQDREGRARSSGNRIWIEFSHERMYLLPIFSFFLSSGGGPWEGAPGGRKKGEGEKERRESRCCTCCLFCARAVCL